MIPFCWQINFPLAAFLIKSNHHLSNETKRETCWLMSKAGQKLLKVFASSIDWIHSIVIDDNEC